MLIAIWSGLRIRGQNGSHLGLGRTLPGRRGMLRTILGSIVVLIAALAAFVAGSLLMANVAAGQQAADMSGYNYLRDNLPMLLLALPAVWLVSSFGEEVLYRGFLITRMAEIGGGSRMAWGVALVISSGVFGLAHFSWGIVGIVQTTLMGLALAISYIVSKRNLWMLVLAHAYMDTLLLVQMYQGSGQ
jgi:membrane protease YdiL (CAAX protease family)